MLPTISHPILTAPRDRRRRRLTMALAALAAASAVASTAHAQTPPNPYAGLANYAAGYMSNGADVPQGGNRYQPGFAGFADFARGYEAAHPGAFAAKHGRRLGRTRHARRHH